MPHELRIRRAEPNEVMELAALGYAAWEHGILPLMREQSGMREAQRRRLVSYAKECHGRIIVAEIGGEIVGWCSRAKGRCYIPFLFVAPHMQSHGIGGQLLRRMESILELEGFDRVLLETPADHVRAVEFYERQGYFILAMKSDGRGSAEALTSIRLEKRLAPFRGPISDIE